MTVEALVTEIRTMLQGCRRPLFFFDDDPDGAMAFVVLYRFVGEGKGVALKTSPELGAKYLPSARDFGPDVVVVLDKPMVAQDFLDAIGVPVIWIDHHQPQRPRKAIYLNPRRFAEADARPTSYWAYRIAEKDLWLALIGVTADWHFVPELAEALRAEFPDLLPSDVKGPQAALFASPLGTLARVVSFNLKGTTADTMASLKILTRVQSPYEILRQETPRGKFLWRKYQQRLAEYERLLQHIKVTRSPLLVHTYTDRDTSYTSDLSNELLYRHPDKVIVVGRAKGGQVKCSLRSASFPVRPLLEKALEGLDGYGGGHEYACGAAVKEAQFGEFVDRLKAQVPSPRRKSGESAPAPRTRAA